MFGDEPTTFRVMSDSVSKPTPVVHSKATVERSENPSSIAFTAPGQLNDLFQAEAFQKVLMIVALHIKNL